MSDYPNACQDAENSVGPDWDAIRHDVPCPLCDYNLRGLRDPRCPECGYQFEWPEVLDPRRQEHDYLLELSARNEIPIYGIDWRDQRQEALKWLNDLGDPYVASAYDEDGRVGIDWGVYGAPETFLISRDGNVLYKHIGPLDESIWQSKFVPIIEAQRGGAR